MQPRHEKEEQTAAALAVDLEDLHWNYPRDGRVVNASLRRDKASPIRIIRLRHTVGRLVTSPRKLRPNIWITPRPSSDSLGDDGKRCTMLETPGLNTRLCAGSPTSHGQSSLDDVDTKRTMMHVDITATFEEKEAFDAIQVKLIALKD